MDEDLSGDDLKVVRYTILFTKRDAEAVLQPEREEIVDYPSSSGAFAALKVADFLGRVEREGIPWPSEWKERPGAGYPEPGQSIRQIPEEDQKYIGLVLSVKDRRPREELVSDRAAVDALREIRDRLEAVRGTQKRDATT